MLIFGLCFILYTCISLGFSPLLASAVLIFTLHNPFTFSGEYCLEVDSTNDVNYAMQILKILNAPLFPYIRVLFSLGRQRFFQSVKIPLPTKCFKFHPTPFEYYEGVSRTALAFHRLETGYRSQTLAVSGDAAMNYLSDIYDITNNFSTIFIAIQKSFQNYNEVKI